MVRYSQLFGRSPMWRRPSALARLPESYYALQMQLKRPGERVHDRKPHMDFLDYTIADPKTLRLKRVPDRPVEVVYPKEAHEGLWGGEGVIKGFYKPRKIHGLLYSRLIFPELQEAILYSEILDKHLKAIVTERLLKLVDENYGFDSYLLNTPVENFHSQLALDLRRKLLVALAKKDFHHDNPERQKYVLEKYKDHIIPLEEAEWFGLTLPNAITKLKLEEAKEVRPMPLKVKYSQELLAKLREQRALKNEGKGEDLVEEKSSWRNYLFGSKDSSPKGKSAD